MSLSFATLLTGLVLLAAGGALLSGQSLIYSLIKGFPRSQRAASVLFGGAALWFLYEIWHLSPADFGDFKVLLFIASGAVAVLAFYYVPDFLAVRGLAGLVLLSASSLLDAAFMEYSHPQRLLMVGFVYLCILAALWLGAQPYRMRDFLEWLFRQAGRPRKLGALLLGYGVLLCIVALTY